MSRKRVLSLFAAIGFLFTSCEQADCPLVSAVLLQCRFYSDKKLVTLNETLTVCAAGTDSILVNQEIGAVGLALPMSYFNATDTFILIVTREESAFFDTLWVDKTNTPHIESPDCPTRMFHTITSVRCTTHMIDSVSLVNPTVDFINAEHIQIHFPGSR